MSNQINIEVATGGFILTYPVLDGEGNADNYKREVFVSPRKLNQKLKEVIDSLSLVSEDKSDKD